MSLSRAIARLLSSRAGKALLAPAKKLGRLYLRTERQIIDWLRQLEHGDRTARERLETEELERELAAQKTHDFVDRSTKSRRLLLVLSGYKPTLWPLVYSRIAQATPTDVDVCLVCSGVNEVNYKILSEIAEKHGWSVLRQYENRLSSALNRAIDAHPHAMSIFKIDEDIFVTTRWMEHLEECYQKAEADGKYRVGFVAPLIPVNGYGYIRLLEHLGLTTEFQKAFPDHPLISAADGIGVHSDPAVAEWLWKSMTPLESVAATLAARPFEYSICPHRFSIGAILISREVWNHMGRFPREPWEGAVGVDEERLCSYCMDKSQVIVIAHRAFCAHFSFGPQNSQMLKLLESSPDIFQ